MCVCMCVLLVLHVQMQEAMGNVRGTVVYVCACACACVCVCVCVRMQVYLGRWRGMRVAVKTLMFHDSGPAARRARQRAVNEAAINTLLSHDCICNM